MKGIWKVSDNYFKCSNTVLRHITNCRVKGKEIRIEEMVSPGVFVPISVDEFRSKYGL